jgi:hypothetical protein
MFYWPAFKWQNILVGGFTLPSANVGKLCIRESFLNVISAAGI